MYPLIRIDKRIPDGSIWQARRSYLLPSIDGWSRVFGPAGTRWSNPLGGWTTEYDGVSIFHPARAFTVSCSGPAGDKRFYIDVAHRVRIGRDLIEFVDLFLDVMIDADGVVTEKDEHQLVFLPEKMRAFTRTARDEVRGLIAARDELFDPQGRYLALPDDVAVLPAATEALARRLRTPVIASGGVGSLEDLAHLSALPVAGCIVGRALYDARFRLREARDWAGEESSTS